MAYRVYIEGIPKTLIFLMGLYHKTYDKATVVLHDKPYYNTSDNRCFGFHPSSRIGKCKTSSCFKSPFAKSPKSVHWTRFGEHPSGLFRKQLLRKPVEAHTLKVPSNNTSDIRTLHAFGFMSYVVVLRNQTLVYLPHRTQPQVALLRKQFTGLFA